MKGFIDKLIFLLLLIQCLSWTNCGENDNPLSPGALAGTWNLFSLTDKTGEFVAPGFTGRAGEPTQVVIDGVPSIVIIEGTLVLTKTRFSFTLTIDTSSQGQQAETHSETISGTYTVSDSIMTLTEEDGTPETATISVSGNQLTLDNNDMRLVFQRPGVVSY